MNDDNKTQNDSASASLLEDSWAFLTRITEQVMSLFSKESQNELLSIGKTLISLGMVYNHVVSKNIVHKKSQIKESKESQQQK